MTGKRFLFVCALVLLGTLVVPSGADRQLSIDPRTGGDGLGNQVLDVLSDATALPTRANNMNTQLSEAGQRMNELNEVSETRIYYTFSRLRWAIGQNCSADQHNSPADSAIRARRLANLHH